MNKNKGNRLSRYGVFLLGIFLLLLFPGIVRAIDTNFTIKGDSTVRVGSKITLEYVINSKDELMTSSGSISTSDESCLKITNVEKMENTTYNNKKYVYSSFDPLVGSKTILKITVEGLNGGCSANVVISNIAAGFSNRDNNLKNASTSKKITVKEKAHNNHFLASLSTNVGSIDFNKNTTNYKLTVKSDVTKATINATAEDSLAKVTGTGTKTLKYGNNKFTITVTAEDGSKKEYAITIVREDSRSKDANLKKLTVSYGTLNFSSSNTSYSINVPEEVSEIKVEAEANDSKAKVSGTGTIKLKENAVTTIKVKVTAENESTKTYTIKVTRGTLAMTDPSEPENPEVPEEPTQNNPSESNNDKLGLKNIIIENGKLNEKFSSNVYSYTYTKEKGFSLKYELENSNSEVEVVEEEDNIYLIVKGEEGKHQVYCLHLEKKDSLTSILIGIIVVLLATNITVPVVLSKKKHLLSNNI